MKKATMTEMPMEKAEPMPEHEMDDQEGKELFDKLMHAEEIKSDSKKMAKVHAHTRKHMKSLKSVKKAIKSTQDLKDVYQEKFGQPKQK